MYKVGRSVHVEDRVPYHLSKSFIGNLDVVLDVNMIIYFPNIVDHMDYR